MPLCEELLERLNFQEKRNLYASVAAGALVISSVSSFNNVLTRNSSIYDTTLIV